MALNPIALVVIAIGALVGALILAYNKSESFRAVCDKVWEAVKVVASAVWNYLVAAFEACSKAISVAWKAVKEFFGISDSGPTEQQTDALNEQTEALENNGEAAEAAARKRMEEIRLAMAAKEAADWQTMSYQQLGEAIEAQKIKVEQLAGTNAKNAAEEAARLRSMQNRYKALGKQYNLSQTTGSEYDGKSLIRNATSYKALGNNIQYYQTQLEKLDPAHKDEITRLAQIIVSLKKARQAISDMQETASRPGELKTLTDYEDEINYLSNLRNKVGKKDIADIDSRIAALKKAKQAIEDAAFVSTPIDDITTFDQLNEQLEHYRSLLNRATVKDRPAIQAHIADLEKLSDQWNNAIEAMTKPADIAALNTSEQLDKAISYWQTMSKRATSEELDGIQSTIHALEKKRGLYTSLAEIGAVKAESIDLKSLGSLELKMQLRLLGADHVKKTIDTIKAALNTPALGKEDRQVLEQLLIQWRGYNKTLAQSTTINDMVTGSLGGISDMLSAIGSATDDSTARVLQWGARTVEACSKAFAAIMAVAAGKAAESVADIPVVGWIMAGAAIASVLASFATIPKFANGGIAYGPTLGLFGEYAGASSNPEVVAPLNKLRELIQPAAAAGYEGGKVVFEIAGRNLRGVLEKEQKLRDRS